MNYTEAIHVARYGSGPPVLMIHGGVQGGPAGGAEQFAAQRPLSEQGWELVLPDRPGHGRTPSRGGEDLEVDAVWVAEMLGDGAHLVGHSYGGAIALCAAGLRPEAVWSLTLIEAPILSVVPEEPVALAFRQQLASAISRENPIEAMIAFSEVVRLPADGLGPPPTPDQLARMGQGLHQMRPPYSWDAAPAIETIAGSRIPALTVTGGWSPCFEAIADELARLLAGDRLMIDAGHHFPQLASVPPEAMLGAAFNHALTDFLRAHSDPFAGASA